MSITCVKHVTSYNKTTTIVNFDWLVADFVGFPMIEFITQVIVFTEYKKNHNYKNRLFSKIKKWFLSPMYFGKVKKNTYAS